MSSPEQQSGPEKQTETQSGQPSAQELLDQRNVPLDHQEEQYWMSVDRTHRDEASPESGLIQASYNFVDDKLGRGEEIKVPNEQELSPYVNQVLDVVASALKDPEIARRVIYGKSERGPEDTGDLRIEEIAEYLEAFKEHPNGDAEEQALRRASLDIATGMVTANFAETNPDASPDDVYSYRPNPNELTDYIRNADNSARHEQTFIDQAKDRVADLENIRRHPAEARTMIAEGLGGSAEPATDTRTQDERLEDARDSLNKVVSDAEPVSEVVETTEPEEAVPDNVVRLDDHRRPNREQEQAQGREASVEEAKKIVDEIAKLDHALGELQGSINDLKDRSGKLQRRIDRRERSGRDAVGLRQQLAENASGQKDYTRQYDDIARYRQNRLARYAEITRARAA